MKFKEYSFKDLLVNIVDNRGKTCPTAEEGIPLIATNCIKNNALYPVFEKIRYVDQDTYDNWFRGHPEPGDMIFVCKGSPGRVCWVPEPINFCIAQDMVAIRANPEVIYPKFLFALLRSEQTQQKILNMHVGTLIPHFKKGDFGNLYFDIPEDMEYQKKVGDAYFEFCNKVELNRQTNQTLEHIAQAIFKSWFVDFEPTRAKIAAKQAGQDPERAAMAAISGKSVEELDQLSAEQQKQLKATAALFPDALVDSELGEIPEGWHLVEAKTQLDVLRGFSYKGKGLCEEGEGVPMHNLNSVLEGGGYKYVGIKHYNLEYKEKFEIRKGDVLVANTEQGHDHLLIGYGSMVPNFYQKGFFSHHLYRVRPKENSRLTPEFVEQLFKPGRFVRQVQGFTNGTTVNMLPVAGLEMPQFVCPPKELAEEFSKQYKSVFEKKESNHLENLELENLRNALLPKLLAGEVFVGGGA